MSNSNKILTDIAKLIRPISSFGDDPSVSYKYASDWHFSGG